MANRQQLDEFNKRVEDAKKTGKLDLSWFGLKKLPEGLWRLHELKELVLTGNYIGEDGAKIIARDLTNLTTLHISGNRIGDEGAKAIGGLRSLSELDIGHNLIGDAGAKEIARLKKLKTLRIEANKIGDEGAAALARQLSTLVNLKIEYNGIGDEGAGAIVAFLTNLESLRIGNNSIGNAGAEAIADKFTKPIKLSTLKIGNNKIGDDGARAIFEALNRYSNHVKILTLRGNPISFMPREAIGGNNAKALLAAYRRYEQARQSGKLVPLNDAKIFIAGDDAVDKASLVELLVNKLQQPASKHVNSQKPVKTIERTRWAPDGKDIAINLWDFAEQEAAFATHQYFLAERGLYIIVLSAHKRHDRSVYHWLSSIKARAGNAPTIVVINRFDDDQQFLTLNWEEIERAYPQAIELHFTSCEQRISSHYESINKLRESIVKTLETSSALKAIRDPFPSSWIHVKKRIAEKVEKKFVLTYDEFVSECRNAGSETTPDDAIVDEGEQRQLLRTLHNLGVVLVPNISVDNFGHPQNLRLLDPDCLARGIDSILNSQKLLGKKGTFNELELIDCLDGTKYPKQHHDKIINFMLDESIGLAALSGAHNTYSVPQAFSAESTDSKSSVDGDFLSFAYLYNPLPSYLLPYFIVKSFKHLGRLKLGTVGKCTRYSASLNVTGCLVYIAVNIERNTLTIRVGGDEMQRPVALEIVRNIFLEVHRRFGLKPEEYVPLPDDRETLAPYEYLQHLHELNEDLATERKIVKKHVFWSRNNKKDYEVEKLLDGILPIAKQKPRGNLDHQHQNKGPNGESKINGGDGTTTFGFILIAVGMAIGVASLIAGIAIGAFAAQ